MRIGAGFLLVLTLAGRTTGLAQQRADTIEVGTGTDIHARIEVRQSEYAVGDTACLRISLVNTVDRPVAYVAMGTGEMVRLVVRRDGTLVKPSVEPQGSASSSIASFRPRETVPLSGEHWQPITVWGYRLEEPGEYRVEAIPFIAGGFAIADTTTVRSNEIAFTIGPTSTPHSPCPRVFEQRRPKAPKLTPEQEKARTDSAQREAIHRMSRFVDSLRRARDSTAR